MSRFENKLSDAKLHNFQSQFVVLDEAKVNYFNFRIEL